MSQRADSPVPAEAARGCRAVRHALALAEWVGTGRPVTAKRVLRRAEVPAAGRALGVRVPARLRSAADVPALHHPWTTALAVGLVSISDGRAVAAPAVAGWRSADDNYVLDCWSRGLAAVLADTFDDDGDGSEALEVGRLALTVLAADRAPAEADLCRAIGAAVLGSNHGLYRTFDRGFGYRDPAEVALEVLAAFGTVTDAGEQGRITPLGRWALPVIGARGASLLGSSDADGEADGLCQLKITLRHVQPACWRRVQAPASATLGDLHEIIQIAFSWDGDHLHGFTVGRRQYGDPYFDAEYDEDKITLAAAFARARKAIIYTYDFGDDWQHEIALEKSLQSDPAATYPVCVDGRGDAPVEDSGEDELAWIPFDLADINADLARLGSSARQVDAQLRADIEVILTDAYGEEEEIAAFETVLDEEIDFPVPGTVLGESLIVTGLTADDATGELRARCKVKRADALVSLTDMEFRPGSVEAWLLAAYLTHIGQQPPTVVLPAGWAGLTRWVS